MSFYHFLVIFTGLFPIVLFGQSSLQTSIEEFVQSYPLKNASISISIMDADPQNLIAQHNPHLSVSPASTQKIITTATALALLGAEYRFKTHLEYDGKIDKNGTLHGNIYIKGFGDPTFASPNMTNVSRLTTILNQLTQVIKKQGIQKIEGKVIGDASYFGSAASSNGWQWYDLGNYYAAGAWSLNIHENLYYLNFQQTNQLGATPRISSISPKIKALNFTNEIQSAAANSGDNAYIYGAPYTYQRFVRGTIPIGNGNFKIKGALPNPPLQAAEWLHHSLQQNGISISQSPSFLLQENSTSRTLLYQYLSPPLLDIIQRANQRSVNLYCESLLKLLGKQFCTSGNVADGTEVVKTFWQQKGVDLEGFYMEDGSGLSPTNVMSSYQLAHILQLIATDPVFKNFDTSLPLAGKTGTIKYLFKNTPAYNNLRAKSGSFNRTRCYAGYATRSNGQRLSFAIFVQNYNQDGKQMKQQLVDLMVELCR